MSVKLTPLKMLVAVDCIVFGFDQYALKILLIQRKINPEKGKWSLMGGLVLENENLPLSAARVLYQLTGLSNIYLEELGTFSEPNRDPLTRTLSVAYFALIDINQYKQQLTNDYHAEWFPFNHFPTLIFDHNAMVQLAKVRLQYKAAFHPILFELLPKKFTLPQLQNLYEQLYGTAIDKGNFSRKLKSSALLIKQKDKDKENSKKGAFYYILNKKKARTGFYSFLKITPTNNNFS